MTVTFDPCGASKTAPLYQYDYGQTLEFDGFDLPSAFEVQFSNDPDGEAVTQIGADNSVLIPDAMLLTGKNVYAWLFLHQGENDGETVYYIEIPVTERAEPTHEEPTPVQQSEITQAIAVLNAGVEAAENSAQAAEAALQTLLSAGIVASDDGDGNVTISLEVSNG